MTARKALEDLALELEGLAAEQREAWKTETELGQAATSSRADAYEQAVTDIRAIAEELPEAFAATQPEVEAAAREDAMNVVELGMPAVLLFTAGEAGGFGVQIRDQWLCRGVPKSTARARAFIYLATLANHILVPVPLAAPAEAPAQLPIPEVEDANRVGIVAELGHVETDGTVAGAFAAMDAAAGEQLGPVSPTTTAGPPCPVCGVCTTDPTKHHYDCPHWEMPF